MSIIATDAGALLQGLPCGARGTSGMIVEPDVAMDVVADRLDPRPSRRGVAEELPRLIREPYRPSG